MTDARRTQFLLGLTGSIGMGKSTAAEMFKDAGAAVWDADAAVHRLYSGGGAAVEPVAALVPEALVNGAIDRNVLKSWIAEQPERLSELEKVVHPLVAADRQDFIASSDAKVLVFDIPLLFETKADAWLDAVAVVTTDNETQKSRVLARPGMTEERFNMILSKQLPDKEKRERADYIIPSDTLEGARAAVQDTMKDILDRLHA